MRLEEMLQRDRVKMRGGYTTLMTDAQSNAWHEFATGHPLWNRGRTLEVSYRAAALRHAETGEGESEMQRLAAELDSLEREWYSVAKAWCAENIQPYQAI